MHPGAVLDSSRRSHTGFTQKPYLTLNNATKGEHDLSKGNCKL